MAYFVQSLCQKHRCLFLSAHQLSFLHPFPVLCFSFFYKTYLRKTTHQTTASLPLSPSLTLTPPPLLSPTHHHLRHPVSSLADDEHPRHVGRPGAAPFVLDLPHGRQHHGHVHGAPSPMARPWPALPGHVVTPSHGPYPACLAVGQSPSAAAAASPARPARRDRPAGRRPSHCRTSHTRPG